MILSNSYELQPYCAGIQVMNAILVLTTADNAELAHRIATALVEAGQAACVSIVPGIRSVYRWEGKICDEGEWLLIIKSVTEQFEAVRSHIRRLHSYQLPEVIAVPITSGDPDYLRWLAEQMH
jgi:periplasmic divalent cation tolerance protein